MPEVNTNNVDGLVIGGDIGGTNSRLALYSVPKGLSLDAFANDIDFDYGQWLYTYTYPNDHFECFDDIFSIFLKGCEEKILKDLGLSKLSVGAVCLAVAGPIADNKVQMTNKGKWNLDGAKIAEKFKIPRVTLINDFVAQGYGLLTLDKEKEVKVLQVRFNSLSKSTTQWSSASDISQLT